MTKIPRAIKKENVEKRGAGKEGGRKGREGGKAHLMIVPVDAGDDEHVAVIHELLQAVRTLSVWRCKGVD